MISCYVSASLRHGHARPRHHQGRRHYHQPSPIATGAPLQPPCKPRSAAPWCVPLLCTSWAFGVFNLICRLGPQVLICRHAEGRVRAHLPARLPDSPARPPTRPRSAAHAAARQFPPGGRGKFPPPPAAHSARFFAIPVPPRVTNRL